MPLMNIDRSGRGAPWRVMFGSRSAMTESCPVEAISATDAETGEQMFP